MIVDFTEKVAHALATEHRVLIHGVPGVGKTYFMKEYCEYNYHYSIIIDCEYEYELLYSYATIEDDETFENTFRRDFGLIDALPNEIYVCFDNIDCSDVFCYKLFDKFVSLDINILMSMRVRNNRVKGICDRTEVLIKKPYPYMEYYKNSKSGFDLSMIHQLLSSREIPQFMHDTIQRNFEDYLNIGGMPQAFAMFRDQTDDEIKIKQCHRTNKMSALDIIDSYSSLSESDRYKCKQIIESMFRQMLTTDYKKYVIGNIRDGATYNEFSKAIEFLVENNIIIKVTNEGDNSKFILFLYDCGVLYYSLLQYCNINNIMIDSQKVMEVVKRNFAVTELNNYNIDCNFWKSKRIAYVDIIYKYRDKKYVCVIESESHKKNKSLGSYMAKGEECAYFHLSEENIKNNFSFLNIPLYAISCANYILKR